MANSNTQLGKEQRFFERQTYSSFAQNGNGNPLIPIQRDLSWLHNYLSFIAFMYMDMLSTGESKNISKMSEKRLNVSDMPDINTVLPYDLFLKKNRISSEERLMISAALAPHFSAGMLNVLSAENPNTKKPIAVFGGMIHANNEFIPTIDTLRFLLTRGNIASSIVVDSLLSEDSKLLQNNVLSLHNPNGNTYWNKQVVQPTEEFLAKIKGKKYEPGFNSNFPASKLTTKLNWNDLVLPYDTMQELKEVEVWLKHREAITQHKHLSRVIKPGFRSLFYGPPGTGKTLTASLLGKTTGLDVYRVDLSMVVSKWVGETEKNLKGIFDQAQNKNWILFFDEADSLFGKRTQNKSSNDRHANQEVAYLLQRIEDFSGLVLLATNLKDNIDEAFSRRFQSMVYFPIPDAETRLKLWENTIPPDFILEESIDLQKIADQHEVAGGIIVNVVRYCVLMALSKGAKIITEEDFETGIMKELRKSGKVV